MSKNTTQLLPNQTVVSISLLEAAKHILHLHLCEQEGLSSGQPKPEEWIKAVDALSSEISKQEGN